MRLAMSLTAAGLRNRGSQVGRRLEADPSWTPDDEAVLAASDRKADRDAALLRLIVAVVIALTLLVIVGLTSTWASRVSFVAVANLCPAILALWLVRSERYRGGRQAPIPAFALVSCAPP